jgi:hypothetical protein
MRKCNFALAFGSALLTVVPAQAQDKADTNSISCVEIKMAQLPSSQKSPIELGDECANEHGWTTRKSTASAYYGFSKILLKEGKKKIASMGLPVDIPDRIKKQLNLTRFTGLSLEQQIAVIEQLLFQELAKTGSKINPDNSIDKLSAEQSVVFYESVGEVLMALFIIEEFAKVYNDPAYNTDEIFMLLKAADPAAAEIEARLK